MHYLCVSYDCLLTQKVVIGKRVEDRPSYDLLTHRIDERQQVLTVRLRLYHRAAVRRLVCHVC